MLLRVAKLVKLPAVTAYLIAGILIGPYFLGSFGIDGLASQVWKILTLMI